MRPNAIYDAVGVRMRDLPFNPRESPRRTASQIRARRAINTTRRGCQFVAAPSSIVRGRKWYARGDSNLRPLGPQPSALSTELRAHVPSVQYATLLRGCQTGEKLAGRQGFEPWVPVKAHSLSRRARSTTLAPTRERWRREWDSNPRGFHPAVFKTAAIVRSATSPHCGNAQYALDRAIAQASPGVYHKGCKEIHKTLFVSSTSSVSLRYKSRQFGSGFGRDRGQAAQVGT